MKVAILISGQPRNYHKGYLLLKKAYLDRYDCDVFINTWEGSTFQATQFFSDRPPNEYELEDEWESRIWSLYKPKSRRVSKPIVFDNKNIVDPVWRQPLQNTKSMFYSIRGAYDLAEEYVRPNKYDCYIRTRFDLQYEESTLDLESLDLSKLHVWKWDTDPRVRHHGYYDVFAIGNHDVMGIYSNVFPKIDWYLNYDEDYQRFLEGDSKLRNEYLLRWHLTTSGVDVVEHETNIPHADGQIIR
jgi:hypothetical protein